MTTRPSDRSQMRPLACRTCGTEVLVEKFSYEHTSIRWPDGADRSCVRFRENDSDLRGDVHASTCPDLRDSIRQAVLDGTLVVDEDPEDDRAVPR
ncbi:hypothetical protein G4X40_16040 [Rhodococcus sp. D2-41]|uniref:Ferredoxin n=1 Tax=Speluncibacter jeojiensis TaxID=2710754 RepID=A0A9X4RDM2_9ACTN|nr:hypothetical protein [Rhodococcus sp. D2-41]MDG3011655.1 hypothetical protein [Rhodococcus sp. D2-41]MDG3014990.1 hypothetical protein [Corynebacteriales bacterium D3-21]